MATTKTKKLAATEFGPSRFLLKVEPGGLELVDPDGKAWGPAACGDHRSVPINETSTDDEQGTPAGFNPTCDACVAQCESVADHAWRHALV